MSSRDDQNLSTDDMPACLVGQEEDGQKKRMLMLVVAAPCGGLDLLLLLPPHELPLNLRSPLLARLAAVHLETLGEALREEGGGQIHLVSVSEYSEHMSLQT